MALKITDRLIGDHKTFRKMSGDIDAIVKSPPAQRDVRRLIRLVELFKDHLVVHAWFEDRYFYPELRRALTRGAPSEITPAYMDHLDHEHKTVDGYVDRLEREVKGVPPSFGWPQTFALLFHGLKSHMRKEEEELFPAADALLGSERLEALSVEMERHRSEAPRIRAHASEEGPASPFA